MLSSSLAGCTGVENNSNKPGKLGPWTAGYSLTEGWVIDGATGEGEGQGGTLNLSEINPLFTFTLSANRTLWVEDYYSWIYLNWTDQPPERRELKINWDFECEDGERFVRYGYGAFHLGDHGNCTAVVNFNEPIYVEIVDEISWGMTYCLIPDGVYVVGNIAWSGWSCEASADYEASNPDLEM